MKRTLKELKEFLKDMKFEMYGNCEIEIIDDTTGEYVCYYHIDAEDFYEAKECDNYIVSRFEIFSHSSKTFIQIELGAL